MTLRRLSQAVLLALPVLLTVSCVTSTPDGTQGPDVSTTPAPVSGPPPVVAPVKPVPEPAPKSAPPRDVVQAERLKPARFAQLPGWKADAVDAAWPALLRSCSVLASDRRWADVCSLAETLGEQPSAAAVRQFFESQFQPWQVANADGSTKGMVTGYYEPLIHGSLKRTALSAWPIYGVPNDLVTVDLGDIYPELKTMRLRGRLEGNKLVPYWTRGEIAAQGGNVPAPVIAWADDPIELFFLQVQGSGRIELKDGSALRIGYADHNGHPYKSIGKWLIDQGELSKSEASMQGIQRWARAHPKRLRELLDQNPAFVFFRLLPAGNDGPLGALGVPLVAERSIAVDRTAVPLGAPVFLATTQPNTRTPLQRLVMAQDTGGAIKGGVRADYFWGFGDAAGALAGRMRQDGEMWVLLPKGWAPN